MMALSRMCVERKRREGRDESRHRTRIRRDVTQRRVAVDETTYMLQVVEERREHVDIVGISAQLFPMPVAQRVV